MERKTLRWTPSASVILTVLICLVGWSLLFAAACAGQTPDIAVQKHYRTNTLDSTSLPGSTIRVEYHLMVGVNRTASIVFGGVQGEPQPRNIMVVVGPNEFEGDMLCFVIDEVQHSAPERLIGVRACFVYDREADTMAPINDPDGIVLEDCGDDHALGGLAPDPKAAPDRRSI